MERTKISKIHSLKNVFKQLLFVEIVSVLQIRNKLFICLVFTIYPKTCLSNIPGFCEKKFQKRRGGGLFFREIYNPVISPQFTKSIERDVLH